MTDQHRNDVEERLRDMAARILELRAQGYHQAADDLTRRRDQVARAAYREAVA